MRTAEINAMHARAHGKISMRAVGFVCAWWDFYVIGRILCLCDRAMCCSVYPACFLVYALCMFHAAHRAWCCGNAFVGSEAVRSFRTFTRFLRPPARWCTPGRGGGGVFGRGDCRRLHHHCAPQHNELFLLYSANKR